VLNNRLIEKKMWSLDSTKTSLLQSQFNGGWNMIPKGAIREGTRTPNAHDGRVKEGKAKMTA